MGVFVRLGHHLCADGECPPSKLVATVRLVAKDSDVDGVVFLYVRLYVSTHRTLLARRRRQRGQQEEPNTVRFSDRSAPMGSDGEDS